MSVATIEERLRLYGSKTRCFCPSVSKVTRIKASLSSPSESNHARSAFLTVFHHTAFAKQGTRKRRQATFSLRKRKSLLMDRTTEKVACPLFPLFLRVCLSGVSYADAEKNEWRMALKIWRELDYFPRPSPITDLEMLPGDIPQTFTLKKIKIIKVWKVWSHLTTWHFFVLWLRYY